MLKRRKIYYNHVISKLWRTGIKFLCIFIVITSVVSCRKDKKDDIPNISPKVYISKPLSSGLNLINWYNQNKKTGTPMASQYFGVYTMQSLGDNLILGISSSFPLDMDGALIASYDGNNVSLIDHLNEQGVHDMAVYNGSLYIAGSDPSAPEGWDFGNFYIYTPPGPMVKIRKQSNVIHGFGLFIDRDTIYVAAVSCTPCSLR